MTLYKCIICGELYLGEDKPSNCPFCGASQKYIAEAENYMPPASDSLSDKSRNNLLAALTLELINADFYRNNYKNAQSDYNKQMFRIFSRIEAEHAAAIKKTLNTVNKPSYNKSTKVFATDNEMYEEAYQRELRASQFYKKCADEAAEPHVKTLFTALSEIENDHVTFFHG